MGWKKIKKKIQQLLKIGVFVEFLQFFDDFQHLLKFFFDFFSTHFFGIFEIRRQFSTFWLKWISFIFSKWLSYMHFTKSILPSLQVENVTAYHPSTIYISPFHYTVLPWKVCTVWLLFLTGLIGEEYVERFDV